MRGIIGGAVEAVDVVLRDGATAHLRPARSDDRAALHEFYQQLSPESRYFRFFGKPDVDGIVENVVRAVESGTAVTLLAEIDHRIVAIGQYFPGDVPGRAEAAFAISDAQQGRGLGTTLLERLGIVARARGITSFEAYLLYDNQKMRQVFADAGFGLRWDRLDGQTSHVILSLNESEELHAKSTARSHAAAHASLTPFFHPQSVAVVGAGRRRGGIGAEIFHNLTAGGFRGCVVPVNAAGGEVEGRASVARVSAIDGDISLAVIAVPCDQVPGVRRRRSSGSAASPTFESTSASSQRPTGTSSRRSLTRNSGKTFSTVCR
jgi:GNAT superfamily N-acetyltransferase